MQPEFKTLLLTVDHKVAHVQLNRPEKANAMDLIMWREIGEIFAWIDASTDVRVAMISGIGKHFCSGIDLSTFHEVAKAGRAACEGRRSENLRRQILWMQEQFSAIEKCRKPVLAAIHGACIGGALDMTTACDMRYGTQNSFYCIKEIDLAMTADVGTLQRLPHLIGQGIMRELAYTGRNFEGEEAQQIGFLNRTYPDRETLIAEVTHIARTIAAKSPLSIRGTKEMLLYSRDHCVADGLNYIATWNAAMLVSKDLGEAQAAQAQKRPAKFDE